MSAKERRRAVILAGVQAGELNLAHSARWVIGQAETSLPLCDPAKPGKASFIHEPRPLLPHSLRRAIGQAEILLPFVRPGQAGESPVHLRTPAATGALGAPGGCSS